MKEAGLLEPLAHKYSIGKPPDKSDMIFGADPKSVELDDLFVPGVFLSLGVLLSPPLYILELWMSHTSGSRSRA